MTRKRKNKNILISREAYRVLELRMKCKLPYNPVIVDDKIFVTTGKEEKDEPKRDQN